MTNLLDWLTWVALAVRTHGGYVSKDDRIKADYRPTTTVESAKVMRASARRTPPTEGDMALAVMVLDYGRSLDGSFSARHERLRELCQGDEIDASREGEAASLFALYLRERRATATVREEGGRHWLKPTQAPPAR